ncbi:MAG: hypothetical protein AMJ41_03500 [candidate division Zixibacteria bacterium DG_27]|nr:MAG: hypothetical protein AMJ41_03500 [candidate division Zixibacteria bacterium DG_27]
MKLLKFRETSLTLALCLVMVTAAAFGFAKKKPPVVVEFTTIEAGALSGVTEPMDLVVKGESEWEYLWDLTHRNLVPKPGLPKIDFEKEMVLATLMGERNSSGYKIEICEVAFEEGLITVRVKNHETPGNLTIMTQPYHIVKIPKYPYKIEFDHEKVR